MPDTLNAVELRRLAIECATRAYDRNCATVDRERFLKMQESLLALADSADWLAGKKAGESVIPSVAC